MSRPLIMPRDSDTSSLDIPPEFQDFYFVQGLIFRRLHGDVLNTHDVVRDVRETYARGGMSVPSLDQLAMEPLHRIYSGIMSRHFLDYGSGSPKSFQRLLEWSNESKVLYIHGHGGYDAEDRWIMYTGLNGESQPCSLLVDLAHSTLRYDLVVLVTCNKRAHSLSPIGRVVYPLGILSGRSSQYELEFKETSSGV